MAMSMVYLGQFLKKIREEKQHSMRYVENQSKTIFPNDKKRHISHTYLRKLEDGKYATPSPIKLKAIAEIYGIDYSELLVLANYIEGKSDSSVLAQDMTKKKALQTGDNLRTNEIANKLRSHLETNEIHAEYFLNSLLSLDKKSLSVINRLVSVMSVQEREIKKKPEHQATLQK